MTTPEWHGFAALGDEHDEIRRMWASDVPPSKADLDAMANYRRHITDGLTADQFRDGLFWFVVTVATFTLAVLALDFAYR